MLYLSRKSDEPIQYNPNPALERLMFAQISVTFTPYEVGRTTLGSRSLALLLRLLPPSSKLHPAT